MFLWSFVSIFWKDRPISLFLKLKSTKRLRPTICYSMTQHPFSFGVFGTTPLLLKNLSSHQISTAYPEFIPRNTFQLLQGSWGFPRPPSLVFLEKPQTKLKFVQLISKQLQGGEKKKKRQSHNMTQMITP